MGGKTSAAVKNRYNDKAYDRIALVVVKGRKDEIRAAAERAGLSLNAYIVKARQAYERGRRFKKRGVILAFFSLCGRSIRSDLLPRAVRVRIV